MPNPFQHKRFSRHLLPEANISEQGNIRSLHLGTPTIQSSMNLLNPTELVLSYSRVMMAWLLFANDIPKRTLHIGLGGGSFVRWLHAYFPDMQQTAIEINPQVIHIARTAFRLPEENSHFEIIQADGAEYIKTLRHNTDLIMVDAFDGIQIIDELVETEFFADCQQALSAQGMFVTNWWHGDKRYPHFVQRLKTQFNGYILEIPAESHGNMAVLAFQAAPKECQLDKLKKRAEKLSEQYHLDFKRMLADAKAHNHHNQKNFLFD